NVVPQGPALVTVPTMVMMGAPQLSVAAGALKVQEVPHSGFLSGAQVMTGSVVSTMVTVWLHMAVLPQASVACQVRVASNVEPQWPVVLVAVLKMVIVGAPQLSVALGASKVQAAPHSTVLA